MTSIELFNDLDTKTVTRTELLQIAHKAEGDHNGYVLDKIINILLANPTDQKFEIEISKKATIGLNGTYKSKNRIGIAKIALDSCGRLKKGFKFLKGGIIEPTKKPAIKKPATKKPPVKKTISKKATEEKQVKDQLALLSLKYNLDGFPKISKGLNGVYLADGHEIADGEMLEDDNFTGLNAKAADVAQMVNELILEKINSGAPLPPWKQSFAAKTNLLAQNFVTKKEYSGSNAIILNVLLGSVMPTPFYVTANQIKTLKANIKKGAKTVPLVYYNFVYYLKDYTNNPGKQSALLSKVAGFEVKRKGKSTFRLNADNYHTVSLLDREIEALNLDREDYISKGFLKYYRVFNVADTTIEYDLPEPKPLPEGKRLEIAEAIVKGFKDAPKIGYDGKQAVYIPAIDTIKLPNIQDFDPTEEYYTTLFHELIHSTLHEDRLNRKEKYKGKDKKAEYAFEELIAELGASYLCGIAGILDVVHLNSAAYLKGWHEKLQQATENYNDFFIFATQQAMKAADYILQGFVMPGQETKPNGKEKAEAKAKALILKLKLQNQL